MRSYAPWTVACVGACLGLCWLLPWRSSAKPPANEPLVLSYGEKPVCLGPHEHWVTAIAFSPDGQTLATGAGDGYLRLWDAASGQLKAIHADDATRGIEALAFSPDGRLVATTGTLFGKEATLWDLASGRIVREIEERPELLQAAAASGATAMVYKGKPIAFRAQRGCAFSLDGTLLATAGDDVTLRDVASGNITITLDHPAKTVQAIAFAADGKTLVTAADDRRVRVWRLPQGSLHATLDAVSHVPSAIAISADGKRIVAAGGGGRSVLTFNRDPVGYLWVWDQPSGSARRIEVANAAAGSLAFVGPTTVVVAAGNEVWSVDVAESARSQPRKLRAHSEQVRAVAVSPDGRLVASGGKDRTVDIVDAATGKLVRRLPGLNDIVSAVATSSDGQRFATATLDVRFSNRMPEGDPSFAKRQATYFSAEANRGRMQPGEVRLWSMTNGRMQTVLPLPACQVTAVEFVAGGDALAVAGWLPGQGGMLSLWNAANGQHMRDFAVGDTEVLSIAVSPDGKSLASGDAGGNLRVHDVASAEVTLASRQQHAIEAVAYTSDGKHLASGDRNRTVRIVDMATGQESRRLDSRSTIKSLDFSPDGSMLAAGTSDPGLDLWNLSANTASRTLKVDADHFATMPGFVTFSPDGRFVVCGGQGKNIAVFDVASGDLHIELYGHYHAPTAACFLPDGRLVSGGEERTIRLWNTDRRNPLATWVAMPADDARRWGDAWVGFAPSGPFVAGGDVRRLVGWLTSGDFIASPEVPERRRRVENLFEAQATAPVAPR